MEESGVRYALAVNGSVVKPDAARRLERSYRCLDCGEHIYLKEGTVRQVHLAHYSDRTHPCSAETIIHEAAKRKLVELLQLGTQTFEVVLTCGGYRDGFGTLQACPDDAQLQKSLHVPAFDSARVEVPFGSYQLDAAACLAGQVVLGLEVYQSHLVDATKHTALAASKLLGAEMLTCPDSG